MKEQLKMLKLERDILKKHTDSNVLPSRNTSVRTNLNVVQSLKEINESQKEGDPQLLKSATKQKTCTCKGNCSSKICGCVKNQRKCAPTCKCNDQTCQNQVILPVEIFLQMQIFAIMISLFVTIGIGK